MGWLIGWAFSLLMVRVAFAAESETRLELGASNFVTGREGVKIHYYEKGNGPAMLLVPGWMMPADIWEEQVKYFSKTHRVIAMDPRSQGKSSDVPDGHYPAARARDIRLVVEQLKLAPMILIGWSTAVTEAVAYVDQFGTEGISALVLVDGVVGADYDPATTPAVLRYASSFQIDRHATTMQFVRSMFRKPPGDEYLTRMVFAALRMPTNSAMASFLAAFTTDNRAVLPRIDRPTLMVVSGGTGMMPVYVEMQKRIPGARMEVFQEAGHALFVDEPERFNLLVDQFVSRR